MDISPEVLMSMFKRGVEALMPLDQYAPLNDTPYNVIMRIIVFQVAPLIIEYNEAFRNYIACVHLDCKSDIEIVNAAANNMIKRFVESCATENTRREEFAWYTTEIEQLKNVVANQDDEIQKMKSDLKCLNNIATDMNDTIRQLHEELTSIKTKKESHIRVVDQRKQLVRQFMTLQCEYNQDLNRFGGMVCVPGWREQAHDKRCAVWDEYEPKFTSIEREMIKVGLMKPYPRFYVDDDAKFHEDVFSARTLYDRDFKFSD